MASNQNGRVQHAFELSILNNSLPFIVDSPVDKQVAPGSPALFICRATGQPPPIIKWYFEGVLLTHDDSHVTVKFIAFHIAPFR